jgi:hypothetical protein
MSGNFDPNFVRAENRRAEAFLCDQIARLRGDPANAADIAMIEVLSFADMAQVLPMLLMTWGDDAGLWLFRIDMITQRRPIDMIAEGEAQAVAHRLGQIHYGVAV